MKSGVPLKEHRFFGAESIIFNGCVGKLNKSVGIRQIFMGIYMKSVGIFNICVGIPFLMEKEILLCSNRCFSKRKSL